MNSHQAQLVPAILRSVIFFFMLMAEHPTDVQTILRPLESAALWNWIVGDMRCATGGLEGISFRGSECIFLYVINLIKSYY